MLREIPYELENNICVFSLSYLSVIIDKESNRIIYQPDYKIKVVLLIITLEQ